MVKASSPEQARASALAIVRRLRSAGHVAYFAGGCVRDELLGLAPTDFDVATDATPDRIRSLFARTAEVGATFGVVLVTPRREEGLAADGGAGAGAGGRGVTVEVATFRSDGPYSDRRRPDVVHFSDPASDAHRRDFTINALFLDPLPDGEGAGDGPGKVIDFVGGQDDLARKIIRAVGDPDARLAEDHLRALRAVRLGARLGFEIEARTAAAIRAHARELQGVSRERIGEEVRRMLAHPTRARAVWDLAKLGLDWPVLMEGQGGGAGGGISRPMGSRMLIGIRGPAPIPTSLAAWAIERGYFGGTGSLEMGLTPGRIGVVVGRWREALCLSNDETTAMASALEVLGVLLRDWTKLGVAGQKRLAGAAAGFAAARELLEVLDADRAAAVQKRVADLRGTASGLCPEPLITGDELIALGFRPGPSFKGTLDRVYDAQLEDRIKTREEGMELARRLGV
jgi:poly(A) polymerase